MRTLQCFRKHSKLAGCSIVTVTTLTEITGLGFYLKYYMDFLEAKPPDYETPRHVDAGTVIGISITTISLLLCNILLFYGVWRRKLICFLPWMLLHAALFFEAVIALIFCIVHSIKTSVRYTYYSPMLLMVGIAIFIFVAWYLVKDVFLALYSSDDAYRNGNGSDFSRDNMLEMQSYCHSSPRVSYVTSMNEMHRIVI
ncbi:uncharacterized protein LOC131890820 isoform X1 [Tigriopus californicus]|uniref:uncharacterized protein LOC131890820 isoform X1 n=1 Tax=Tigriopus californicus TaxID=6832 RepID=UPI0027D9DC78|nr:uncharacterized protein LOC131890820 isoform X1 [Tigriopus californicus]XP_059096237.1 uncharacterized protein LOC131890820 isoform X1 [Tigriopus californicus]XP_059096238.1 uncharacterized protein LOC131890820 isoform X1 [Tigriopus californicus]XP_059096239.1 uncharacterized protein LOC131890820 isoform X1 [Tigriopus californicus]XP_059096241.1 uncharacterized protein LOC131890820 isoform X1 [Tigriopus californicus]XP_059096242.1 uncharacterized protein LOC131890820 isoform X1 [Tigriopus c